jgi:hypothetical protein
MIDLFTGDGSDGDASLGSGLHIFGYVTYYNNLALSSDCVLDPGGYPLHVKGTLTIDAGAKISASGQDGGAVGGPGAAYVSQNWLGSYNVNQGDPGTAGGTGVGTDNTPSGLVYSWNVNNPPSGSGGAGYRRGQGHSKRRVNAGTPRGPSGHDVMVARPHYQATIQQQHHNIFRESKRHLLVSLTRRRVSPWQTMNRLQFPPISWHSSDVEARRLTGIGMPKPKAKTIAR